MQIGVAGKLDITPLTGNLGHQELVHQIRIQTTIRCHRGITQHPPDALIEPFLLLGAGLGIGDTLLISCVMSAGAAQQRRGHYKR